MIRKSPRPAAGAAAEPPVPGSAIGHRYHRAAGTGVGRDLSRHPRVFLHHSRIAAFTAAVR